MRWLVIVVFLFVVCQCAADECVYAERQQCVDAPQHQTASDKLERELIAQALAVDRLEKDFTQLANYLAQLIAVLKAYEEQARSVRDNGYRTQAENIIGAMLIVFLFVSFVRFAGMCLHARWRAPQPAAPAR